MYKKFLYFLSVLLLVGALVFSTGDRKKWLRPEMNPLKHSILTFDFKENALTYAASLPSYLYHPLSTSEDTSSFEKSFSKKNMQEAAQIFDEICRPIHRNHILIAIYDDGMIDPSLPFSYPEYFASPFSGKSVKIYGFRRVFNFKDSRLSLQKPHTIHLAKLNISSGYKDDFLTAVVYKLSQEQFISLRETYPGYDLVPAVAQDYNDNNKPFFICYTWKASLAYIDEAILPHKHSYAKTWELLASPECAKHYGTRFSQDYLNTTFLADGHSIMEIHEEYK